MMSSFSILDNFKQVQEKFKLSFDSILLKILWKTEHLLLKSKCSIFHNILNTFYFKDVKGRCYGENFAHRDRYHDRMAHNLCFSTGGVAVAIAVPQLMGIILGRTLVGQIEYQLDIVASSHRLRNRRQRN